jgi:hypothetical protein
MLPRTALGSILSLITAVLAQGYVQKIAISNPATSYTGYLPYTVSSLVAPTSPGLLLRQ